MSTIADALRRIKGNLTAYLPPALLDRLPPSDRIVRATQHGTDGIVEALHSLKVDLHV